jgi:multicomponent Na+:H+ antiporter subunit G
MTAMTDWLAALLLVAGGTFCLIAGVGVVRFRDVYTRMHASTKAGTFGLALIAAGTAIAATDWGEAVEAMAVFLFLIATAPVGSHLVGRAAFRSDAPEVPGTSRSADTGDFRATPIRVRASGESDEP